MITSTTPLLQLDALRVAIGEKTILQSISLDVAPGECGIAQRLFHLRQCYGGGRKIHRRGAGDETVPDAADPLFHLRSARPFRRD